MAYCLYNLYLNWQCYSPSWICELWKKKRFHQCRTHKKYIYLLFISRYFSDTVAGLWSSWWVLYKSLRVLAKIDLSLEDAKNSVHVWTSPSFSQCNNKLELKSFSGNYEGWQSFWDTFESTINWNTDISIIQKFTYLKSRVTGAAESAITGLPLTEDNDDL